MRTAPKRLRKRPTSPLGDNLGLALFGQAAELAGATVLLVAARVGTVRRLPPGYELAECQECLSPCWVNGRFVADARRRGLKVRVECSACALGECPA